MTAPPCDTSRLFVVQQSGQIRIINLPSRRVNATPYLDVSSEIVYGGEQTTLPLSSLDVTNCPLVAAPHDGRRGNL